MKKMNQTLFELIIGILISGVLIQLAVMAATGPNLKFSVIYWLGTTAAVALSVHMYRSIDRALDMPPEDAEKYMRKAYMLRTLFIFALAGGVVFLAGADDIIAVFLGILCLKFGAFLQPVTHRILEGRNK